MTPRAFAEADGTIRRSFNHNARTLSFSVGHAARMNVILSEMSEVCPLFADQLATQPQPPKTIGSLDCVARTMHEEELSKAVSLKEKRDNGKDNSAKDGGLFGIFYRHAKRELDSLCALNHLNLCYSK
jgi:hypothetical protein